MKRVFVPVAVLVFLIQLWPVTYAESYEWVELSSVEFGDSVYFVSAVNSDSRNVLDRALTYNDKPTLQNTSTGLNKEDGILISDVLPALTEKDIGHSYKVKASVYPGTLLNGRYNGITKLRIGVTDGDGNGFSEIKDVAVRSWTMLEFTYTVTKENLDCDKIIIDRGGKDTISVCPRNVNFGGVSVYKSCNQSEANKIAAAHGSLWTKYSFDGFENTIVNADVTKESTGMRMLHSGNAVEEIENVGTYEGYSCLYTYANKSDGGYVFSNLLPTFTESDIGRSVKVSVYFYVQQLISGQSDKVGMKFGISSEDETQRELVTVYGAYGKWSKFESEFEITEKNINYNKILLTFDNGWNYPMWSRVDNVMVQVTKRSDERDEIPVLSVDGTKMETEQPLRIIGDSLMLPAKETFDALGAGSLLSKDGREITATFGKYTAAFTADSDTVNVGGREIHDFIKPVMIDKVLYIPYTAMKVAFKATAEWDGLSGIYNISTNFPIVRRNVPKSTLTDNSDPYDLHFDEYNPIEVIPWDQLPESQPILNNDDLFKAVKVGSNYGTFKEVAVEGQNFDRAWQVECTTVPPNAYNFQLNLPEFPDKYEEGDILMVTLTYRVLSVTHEDGEGSIGVVVEQNGGSYLKALSQTVSAKPGEWTTVHLPFVAKGSPSYPYCRPNLVFGSKIQTIEVGGYSLVNFKDKMILEQFDVGTGKKNAVEEIYNKDAQWRKDAIARIEQIRKGDINVVVVDRKGNPIPDADVKVSMYEHEFEWGTAVNNIVIGGKTMNPEIITSADIICSLFNSAVAEDATKWGTYRSNRFAARQLKDYLEQKGLRNFRGHVSIWDGVTHMPQDVVDVARDKKALDNKIYTHFDALYGDYGDFSDWDIMNETVGNHYLADIYGHGVWKDWFEYAQARLPEGTRLQYNETSLGAYMFKIVEELQEQGAPITSLGMQSHLALGVNEERYNDLFKTAEKMGIRVKVTEFDLNEEDPYLQAGNTRDFMIAAFSSPVVDGFYMWGYADNTHWLKNAPILRKSNDMSTIKPSGEQFIDLVYNKWWTREEGKTGEDGIYSVRGYYGDYDITVTKGGASKTVQTSVSKYKDDNTVIVTFY